MGNDSSVLVKHGGLIGHGRRMSKAQSSTLINEIKHMSTNSQDESVNSPSAVPSKEQRRTSGAYIKRREQQQQRRKPLALAEPPAGRTALQARRTPSRTLEKQESSASSRGSHDESSSGCDGDGTAGDESPVFTIPEETPVLSAKNGHLPTAGGAKAWVAKHRKESMAGFSENGALLGNGTGNGGLSQFQQKRHRSASLCAAQMKADCQAIATLSYQHALGGNGPGRKASVSAQAGVMPPLTRLRIQQCFRNAKPIIGHQILKRASALRSEFKSFLSHLREDKAEELSMDIYRLVTECVANVEMPSKVAATSFAFGEMHAQLCNLGFRPDFFSVIADATIAECVRLDGGAQKRCETLMAWSQLMQFMFSNVRDGYYAEVRQQRRSSLPQQRLLLKQASIAVKQGGEKEVSPASSTGDNGSIGSGKGRKKAAMLQQGISFDMNI